MLADRLRLARKRAGLSLRDLAGRLDGKVSAQAISKYESDVMLPSAGVLVALGKALDVSLDFLMSGQVTELAGVEFRKHSGTSAADRARVEAAVIDQVERYLAVEEILGLDSEEHSLKGREKITVRSFADAEGAAVELREVWALGTDPIPSMTALLEEKGLKVILAPLPERVSGLTCDVRRPHGKPPVPVIVARDGYTVERQRFTLAHELAHRLIGAVEGEVKLEKAMHRFAAAFLVPADHLRSEVGKHRQALAFQELVRLKHLYGVGAAAMLLRLKDAGILSEEAVTYAFQTYARPWRTREPQPLSPAGMIGKLERPERFEQLVYRALAEQLIPVTKAATLLKRSASDVERAVKWPDGDDANHHQ